MDVSGDLLLALAREIAHDKNLESVEALSEREREQLRRVLAWATADDVRLLTTRRDEQRASAA